MAFQNIGIAGCATFALFGFLVLGAVLLRAAVSLANKCLGASPLKPELTDDDELDEWIGYRQLRSRVERIPEPGLAKGILCAMALLAVDFIGDLVISFLFGVGFFHERYRDDFTVLASHIFALLLTFPLCGWVLAKIIPTPFGRACLVLLMNFLIVFSLVGGLAAVIYIVF